MIRKSEIRNLKWEIRRRKILISGFRFLFSALTAIAVSACGFHPLYGRTGANASTAAAFASIYVEPIPERVGYELRNALLDGFASQETPGVTAYRLKIDLKTEDEGLALQSDASITRYNYRLVAHYQLVAAGGTTVLKKGEVHSLTSYNVVSSPFATVSAKLDAQTRAAQDVAERIRTELAVYFTHAESGGS